MSASTNWVALPGSERDPLPGARATEAADPAEHILVTVVVRRKATAPDAGVDRVPFTRGHLRREDFAARYGGQVEDMAAVAAFARSSGLTVVESHPARRSIVLSGTVAAFSAAFGVELSRYDHAGGTYRGRTGPVYVPAELAPVIEGVFGLDDRPQAEPHFQHATVSEPRAGITFTPAQVARLYNFPEGTGQGQTIAIIELGGGFRTEDLQAYFGELGIPLPSVSAVSVDGGQNAPTGDPRSADAEVMLDIEAAGAVAPGADIVVYFAPNSSQGFLDAITTAVHDTANRPSVISISWGTAEEHWTRSALLAMEGAFADAGLLGVTVCAAAGDGGSADGIADGSAHADYPASSPHVLGCGGTKLAASSGVISSEVVWNDGLGATGGGLSKIFPVPAYQSAAGVANGNRRGVPDVAGDADPDTGYLVRIDGAEFIIGGTSAVAPLWAGLVALMNENLGESAGFLHPYLYKQPAAATFRDITEGSNDVSGLGLFAAGPGWDPCTGMGTPDGARLLAAVSGELTRQGVIAHLRGLVGVAGYITGDGFQHVIAATGNGDIHEIYWQGAGTVSQGILITLPGLVSVAGYATGDGFQHVIAATDNGDIHEIYWQGGGSVSQGILDTVPGVLSVAGYVTGDGFQHVIAATGNGDIHEIYWPGGGSVAQGVVATVPNVNSVAGYITAADGVQHVIASAGFAQIREIFWPGGGQPSEAVLDWSTGQQAALVVGVAGYFTADDGFQHVIVACGDDGGSPGDIFEVYFKQG
jgi:kumamolisin